MSNVLSFKNWVRVNESNRITFVSEQVAAYWDNVKGIGSTEEGKKVVIKNFAAKYPLTHPEGGALSFADTMTPVFVGAQIQAQYQPLAKPVDSAGNWINAPFGYSIEFLLSDTKGAEGWPNNKQQLAEYFKINGARLKSNKFQIYSTPIATPEFSKRGMKAADGTRVSMELSLASNMLFADLDGWMGSLRNDINLELKAMGYELLPNSIKRGEVQFV